MPPDYSGYAPRQQQRQPQDPWVEGAVGLAKLFMPDPEMQAKARQSQQQEDYNAARLADTQAGTEWTKTRNEFDKKRTALLDAQKALHAERGAILAKAAAEGRDFTPAEAARLVAINGEIRGTVGANEVSGFFALPGAKKRAADKASAAKATAERKAAADAAADKLKAQEALAAKTSVEFRDRYMEHSKPIDQVRLANNLMQMFESTPMAQENGWHLTKEAASAIAFRAAELGYTDAQIMEAAKNLLFNRDVSPFAAAASDLRLPLEDAYSAEQIKKFKDAYAGPDWATEERNYKGAKRVGLNAVKALSEVKRGDPTVLRVEGTPEKIRDFVIKNPGKKILFFDVTTGRYGGGISNRAPTIEEGFEPEVPEQRPDGFQVLLPWTSE